jgi:hypothetical protein
MVTSVSANQLKYNNTVSPGLKCKSTPFMIDWINPSDAPDALDGMLRSKTPAAHWARLPLPPGRFVPFGPATFSYSVRPIFCDH